MKIYAKVLKTTPLTNREKKDHSGEYLYADVTIQPFDLNAQPGTHALYDALTGERYDKADELKMDAIREKAEILSNEGWKPGDVVIADVDAHINQYGHNEIIVRSITRYQSAPQP